MTEINDLTKSKLDKLAALRKNKIEPYPYRFEPAATAAKLHEHYAKLSNGDETNDPTVVAGRIKIIRSFGKLVFLDLWDHTGKIQIQLRENDTTAQSLALVENLDAGDWIGVSGRVIKTKRGELSVLARELTMLSKSVLPLPEKWHGLTDTETRYRQRYLDLIMNPDVRKVFETRSRILTAVRKYLDDQGFLEVEIPTMQPVYGGANAKPFKTKSNALKQDLYLSISPELYLKRLIVGGYDKVYYLGKNFRNEDIDKTHNPEFAMMQCY
ncbi:MAG: amino acid--tRNA ligase-related protein, partial [Candidatus Diapherotrites archaeon]|nr:amino acid--tRNA ligase-related protein [Candidatus Diapherotrites archaeon]